MDEPTADPNVVIEEKLAGYVRYRSLIDNSRWEVRGTCIKLGYCLVGAVLRTPNGFVQVESLEHLEQLKVELGADRVDSEMDVPVTPGFSGCCALEIITLAD